MDSASRGENLPPADPTKLPGEALSLSLSTASRIVLLVDRDVARAATLAAAGAPPGCLLRTATSLAEATRVLEQEPVAAVVLERQLLDPDPLTQLFALQGRFPLSRLAVFGGEPEPELSRSLAAVAIPWPAGPLDEGGLQQLLAELVRREPGFTGTVADFDLIDTLQLLHLGRHSRGLRIVGPRETGTLVFVEGELVHAQLGEVTGVEAFLAMLKWTGGLIQSGPVPPDVPRTVTGSWVHLAMEGLRRLDEERHREMLGASSLTLATPVPVSLRELSPSPAEEPGRERFSSDISLPTISTVGRDPLTDSLLEGRYTVGRLLAVTPLLRRYEAEQTQGGRQVWLDVLDDRLLGERGSAGWQAVRNLVPATRSLADTDILHPLDVGEVVFCGRPTLFLVTPAGTGEPLELSNQAPLSVADGLDVLRQLATALRGAHQQGLIHGNLHPGNLLLQAPAADAAGRPGRVQVLELGLLPALLEGRNRRLDQEWSLLGSPVHLAPEQLASDAAPGPRADVYALTVILYQLLSGNPPFRQATLTSLVAAKLSARPPLLSLPLAEPQRSQLEQVLQRGLAHDPLDRPRTVDELVRLCELALEATAPSARPAPGLEPGAPDELPSYSPAWSPGAGTGEHPLHVRRKAAAFVESRLSTPLAAVGLGGESTAELRARPRPAETRLLTPLPEPPGSRSGISVALFVAALLFVFACGLAVGLLLLP